MKKIFFTYFLVIVTNNVFAQSWNWALKLGNIKSDKATCIKTDDSGYIYVAGYFSDSIYIGTNNLVLGFTSNIQSKEIYIAKLDSFGYCYWAKSGGQYFDDRILGMDVDSAGNVVVTGTFWEGSGINMSNVNVTGSAFGYGDQCFVYKLDRNGNVLWGNFVCSDYSDDQGLDVATDKAGNSYVVGFMSGTNLFCGGNIITAINNNIGNHKHSYWVAKINANGVFQWAKTFGGLPWDASENKYLERDIAVCVDEKDGVYITGGYDFTRPFGNTTLTTTGGYDIFVLKYDTAGNYKWATNAGSKKDDWSNGICSDKNGFVYITGEFRDSLIMDTIIVKNYNGRDAFVIKIDPNTGKPIWGKHAGSNKGSERGNDIVADNKCNIYVCGEIESGAKFGDNILTPPGKSIEAFIARISTEGKWNWVATGGGIDSTDRANAIAKGKNGQIYTCGFFRSPATYGATNLISTGKSDGFMARIQDGMVDALAPFALYKPSDSLLCKGEAINLIIPKNTYFDYNPKTNVVWNSTNNQITFSPSSTTTYTLIALGTEKCPSYDTIIFTLILDPHPIADFNINPIDALITSPIFTLTNTSQYSTNYKWLYNNVVFSTSKDTTFTAPVVGNYCFTLIATNTNLCADTITHCGTVIDLQEIFIPNAFAPNSISGNNTFKINITNAKVTDIKEYNMQIVNRFGEIVFKSSVATDGWNGKINSDKDAELGTYFYTIKCKLPNGKKYEHKGDIMLVR